MESTNGIPFIFFHRHVLKFSGCLRVLERWAPAIPTS
jgi:hypothetical protein